ncbi:hypothetical protein [Clostridium oceanicum]|uniref:Uncharacterized protein n=1 Tax=Clostridium oceanicum TaxID=1543 RepID=A0ABN1JQY0_9CLOT
MLLKLLKEIAYIYSCFVCKFAKKFNITELMIKDMIYKLIKFDYRENIKNKALRYSNEESKVCSC